MLCYVSYQSFSWLILHSSRNHNKPIKVSLWSKILRVLFLVSTKHIPKVSHCKILNRYLHEQEIIWWVIIGRLGGVLRKKILHKKPFFTQIKTYFLHSRTQSVKKRQFDWRENGGHTWQQLIICTWLWWILNAKAGFLIILGLIFNSYIITF